MVGEVVFPTASAPEYINISDCRIVKYGWGHIAKFQVQILQDIAENNNTQIMILPFALTYEYNFVMTILTNDQKFTGTCLCQINSNGCFLYNNPSLYRGQIMIAIAVIPDVY